MAGTGSTTETVYLRLVRVSEAVEDERRGDDARRRATAEDDLVDALVDVREGGDLDAILESERVLLKDEYDRFANTAEMRGSLETALEELEGATAMVGLVRSHAEYVERVDATHRFRTHRVGNLPRDDARMFFAAHGTRLLNLLKARGTDGEKAVLSARRRNLLAAERAYRELQTNALGIEGALEGSQ